MASLRGSRRRVNPDTRSHPRAACASSGALLAKDGAREVHKVCARAARRRPFVRAGDDPPAAGGRTGDDHADTASLVGVLVAGDDGPL